MHSESYDVTMAQLQPGTAVHISEQDQLFYRHMPQSRPAQHPVDYHNLLVHIVQWVGLLPHVLIKGQRPVFGGGAARDLQSEVINPDHIDPLPGGINHRADTAAPLRDHRHVLIDLSAHTADSPQLFGHPGGGALRRAALCQKPYRRPQGHRAQDEQSAEKQVILKSVQLPEGNSLRIKKVVDNF